MTESGPFNRPDVVARYAELRGLFDSERTLFNSSINSQDRVLDLGVGIGRTAAELAVRSNDYVGIDIAPNMVAAATSLHPELRFEVGDACDLGQFTDGRFDVVVFSFNGLDYITSRPMRDRALGEIRRVLSPDGRLIFSSHDPRAVIARPNRDLGPRALPVAALQSVRRVRRRLGTRALWRGEGVIVDAVYGGTRTYMSTPTAVRAELERTGFELERTVPGPDSAPGRKLMTEWWYYLARSSASTVR